MSECAFNKMYYFSNLLNKLFYDYKYIRKCQI